MLRRVTVMLTVTASLTWVGLGWVRPVAARASEPAGWSPIFSEAFNGQARLPSGCTASEGAPDGPAASHFRPEAVSVSGGMLRLGLQRRVAAGKPFTTGELRCAGTTQRFGRYEIRARAPLGAGITSLVALRPVDAGAHRHTTRLELLARPGDEKAYVSNGYGTGVATHSVAGAFSDFHTYVVEWSPAGLKIFVDDQERLADPRVSAERRWFELAVTAGEPRTGMPTSATALPAEFVVDYVRIWAYDPSATPLTGPSTAAAPPRVAEPPRGGGAAWSGWLAAVASVAALLATAAFVMRRTRSRRPPSAHRL